MLTKINNYSISDQNASALMQTEDTQRIGLNRFIMYNPTNSATPGIAQGSVIEVNGTLFQNLSGNELLTYHDADGHSYDASQAPDGQLYICLIPDGDNSCNACLKAITTSDFSYDNVRLGYYQNNTQARVVGSCVKSGSTWSRKRLFYYNDPTADGLIQIYQEGMEATGFITGFAPGVTDSKVLLSSDVTPDAPISETVQRISHPCHCNLRVDIVVHAVGPCEGTYYYQTRFIPTGDIGNNNFGWIDANIKIPMGMASKTIYYNPRGDLLPGDYIVSHKLISVYASSDFAKNGRITITSTLTVGDVFGHRTGKILS